MEVSEQLQFVFYVQDGVSAVDDVESTLWEGPLSGVSHLELDLRQKHIKLNKLHRYTVELIG